MEELNQVSGSGSPTLDWSERGAAAVRRGDFAEALDAYEQARERAASPHDRDRVDLNIAMVRLQMGDAKGGEEGLREILLRAPEARTAFHAAYNLASSLRKQGRHERALLYARRAMERARETGEVDLVAPTHNLLGNILLTQNYLDEALGEYHAALGLRQGQAGDTRFSRAIVEDNIGYCMLLQLRFADGILHIRRALALAEETGDRRCRAECLQDLCYALLMDGRWEDAVVEGERALEEATRSDCPDLVENCHYLLGELGSRTGRYELRDRHFEALQHRHPEVPFLREFLCSVDVTNFITLRR